MEKARSRSSLDTSAIFWSPLTRESFSVASTRDENFVPAIQLSVEAASESQPLMASGALRDPEPGTGVNWVMTSFLIINTALGIGLLNFPASYDQAGGIFWATLIQVVMVVLMMSTMLVLAYCSDYRGDRTYHDVLLTMCGKRAQQMAALSITCTLYCVCVASLIIIGDQMDSLFLSVVGPTFCHYWYLERHFTITIIGVLLVWPMCYCKTVDFLRYVGPIGIFAMLYPVFLTVYGYFKLDIHAAHIKTRPDDWASMFAVVPVLGLGYQCQEVVVPIYSCMKSRNLCNFTKSSILAMALLFVIYSITGCFGYLTFGSDVAHNVMKMFSADDPVVMIGVGALTIKMIVTYPILALCGRDAVIGLYAEISGITVKDFHRCEKSRRYTVASIWFITSLALAVFTGGIGIVIRYLGCVASANIFVYPGICLIRTVMKEDPTYGRLRSRLMLAYGVFIVAFGFFCVGVIFVKTVMSKDTEIPNRECT